MLNPRHPRIIQLRVSLSSLLFVMSSVKHILDMVFPPISLPGAARLSLRNGPGGRFFCHLAAIEFADFGQQGGVDGYVVFPPLNWSHKRNHLGTTFPGGARWADSRTTRCGCSNIKKRTHAFWRTAKESWVTASKSNRPLPGGRTSCTTTMVPLMRAFRCDILPFLCLRAMRNLVYQ